MVEFVSLFLGLVVGLQPVEVSVGPGVASAEIRIDGQLCGTLESAPWQHTCDFGRLLPHHLEAVAFDEAGDEAGRAEQWVNLPRPRSEANLSLVGEVPGRPDRARLIWESLDFDRPERISVSFDGKELPVDDEGGKWIDLPAYDPDEFHILSADLVFSDTVTVRANAVFGGAFGERVSTRLTAIALENQRRRRPGLANIEAGLSVAGQPVRVVAVERTGFDLIVVREQSTGLFEALQRLVSIGSSTARARLPDILTPTDRVRFAFPAADAVQGRGNFFELVPISSDVTRLPEERNLYQILTGLSFTSYQENLPSQRLADAVAVAGVVAAQSNRRRMVLLLTAEESTDISRLPVALVRAYLDSLAVPLTVWRFRPPRSKVELEPSDWGTGQDIADFGAFGAAHRALREALDRQFVAWIDGQYLPQAVTTTDLAGFSMARRPSEELTGALASIDARTALISSSDADKTMPASTGEPPAATGSPSGTSVQLTDARMIDRARGFMAQPTVADRLGPLFLLTDLKASRLPRLMRSLERIANQIPALYSSHYGLAADLTAGATVALFADESSYRNFEATAQVPIADLAGHATSGMVALYAGNRASSEIEGTLIHELVHLLNMRALGPQLAPWLDEGLAEATTLAIPRGPRFVIEPLDPRRPATIHRRPDGPLSNVSYLAADAERGRLPELTELSKLDRRALDGSADSRKLYTLAALWVHYLGSVEPATRQEFLDLLVNLAADPELTGDRPADHFTMDSSELERRFRNWLRNLARATAPQ